MQFCMIPLNFLSDGSSADYVNTGTWSTKAIKEAQQQNKPIKVAATSEDRRFCYIPKDIRFSSNAVYAHLTSNNTIKGTQFGTLPDTDGIPMVIDMSSDIMSRPLDMENIGMIYAGAQKNIGPAGVCMVIIRKDLLDRVPDHLPAMLSYKTFADKNSMFNTPPCFGIYTIQLVLKWIEKDIGGLEKMAVRNREKAALLYEFLDASGFYRATAERGSRSLMNVTFRLPNETLEANFVSKALENGLGGLKGHRSVGGCRASIYNATDITAINDLISFMKEFEKTAG